MNDSIVTHNQIIATAMAMSINGIAIIPINANNTIPTAIASVNNTVKVTISFSFLEISSFHYRNGNYRGERKGAYDKYHKPRS